DDARLHGRREPARAKPIADRLQRVARRDLRVAPLVRVPAGALARDRTRLRTIGFQAIEPRAVHGLERQLELKPLVGRGIEIAGGTERALALHVRAIALEAKQTGLSCGSSGSGRLSERRPLGANRLALQRLAAGGAHHLRGHPLELATWKANPLVCNDLR